MRLSVRRRRGSSRFADRILLSARSGGPQAYGLYLSEGVEPRRQASVALEKLIEINDTGAARAEADGIALTARAKTIALAALAAAIGLAALLALVIVRSIARGIDSVIDPMTRLTAGDLDVTIPHQGTGTEIGRIADAVQRFREDLTRMKQLEAETALARAGPRRSASRPCRTWRTDSIASSAASWSRSAARRRNYRPPRRR